MNLQLFKDIFSLFFCVATGSRLGWRSTGAVRLRFVIQSCHLRACFCDKSRGKLSFCKRGFSVWVDVLPENARFVGLDFQFWWEPSRKCLFWNSGFSVLGEVLWTMFVLEVFVWRGGLWCCVVRWCVAWCAGVLWWCGLVCCVDCGAAWCVGVVCRCGVVCWCVYFFAKTSWKVERALFCKSRLHSCVVRGFQNDVLKRHVVKMCWKDALKRRVLKILKMCWKVA